MILKLRNIHYQLVSTKKVKKSPNPLKSTQISTSEAMASFEYMKNCSKSCRTQATTKKPTSAITLALTLNLAWRPTTQKKKRFNSTSQRINSSTPKLSKTKLDILIHSSAQMRTKSTSSLE